MINKKTLLTSIATFILTFNIAVSAYAQDPTIGAVVEKSKYPDYSCAFTGKDTCEKFNRKIFFFNSKVNKYIVRPANIVWASVMPKYGMDRIQNMYTNIEFPIRLVSCLLQKDFHSSKTETVRFLTNTTLGLGGLYDPARTRFKIEPRQEDMGQVLAYRKVKEGPYVVLPIIASGNVRDLAGQLLDCPLNPTSYVVGPVALVAKSVSVLNKTTYLQSLVKSIDYTYADPYEIRKKLHGIDRYIKNSNLDRSEVLAEKIAAQKIFEVKNTSDLYDLRAEAAAKDTLKADIQLKDYNPQSPVIDSMRTALFECENTEKSIWSDLSVWNRGFSKQIKTSSVNVDTKHPNYKYRYILQKDKTAPLAIIYPSFGEGIMSNHSIVLAKMFFDEGYSVLIQGSTFQWEFVKSMPDGYKPGYPAVDANYSRIVTAKILNDFSSKKGYSFNKKILVGTSFGALTTLFVASKEEAENTLGIDNYISINPPIEVFFALERLDKYSQDWKNNPDDVKMRAALTAEKIIQLAQNISTRKTNNVNVSNFESLPFTDDEAKLVIGFIMKQKLSDVVFTIENCSQCKKNEVYETIKEMSFYDYAQKYLLVNQYKSAEHLNQDTSLYSISEFLQKNEKYKIYHAIDDYYVNKEQLIWLKKQAENKAVYFNNGSHLGFLYRKEFIDEFKKDIKL